MEEMTRLIIKRQFVFRHNLVEAKYLLNGAKTGESLAAKFPRSLKKWKIHQCLHN